MVEDLTFQPPQQLLGEGLSSQHLDPRIFNAVGRQLGDVEKWSFKVNLKQRSDEVDAPYGSRGCVAAHIAADEVNRPTSN